MLLKVFDFFKSCLWYVVDFIYGLIDSLITIMKDLNAFDIVKSLSENTVFQSLYKSILAIAVTLFALFIIWKLVNKILEPDDETTIKSIVTDAIKCGVLILLSTFMFVQVSSFSIKLSGYVGNIFENSNNTTMSANMLGMFITYNEDYKSSDEFEENKTIYEYLSDDSFGDDGIYLEKYVTKHNIFGDDKDYKYDINWIMAIICGGFFLYSLFFASIMLGKRQIEFLFLFCISPIVFATSVCNKQRRGAVIEQLVSLALQSAVMMLIIGLTVMIMQQVMATTFSDNFINNMIIKVLMYLGCAIFILTGSQVINRFIGSNVSASSGREQLMSLMGYGKLAGAGAVGTGAAAVGGALLSAGLGMKLGNFGKNKAMSAVGSALGTFGSPDPVTGKQSRMQKIASTLGTKMHASGQMGLNKSKNKSGNFNKTSNAFVNAGASAFRTVMPRSSYNASYYRRRNNIF